MVRTKELGIISITSETHPELMEASIRLLRTISDIATEKAKEANVPIRFFYDIILLKSISILIEASHESFNKAALMQAMMKE